MDQNGLKWKQRVKRNWYNGDQNTKCFHAFVNQRHKKNFIKKNPS